MQGLGFAVYKVESLASCELIMRNHTTAVYSAVRGVEFHGLSEGFKRSPATAQ